MHRMRTVAVAAGIAAGALLLTIAPAGAHVEPDPSSVKPGKPATVAFTPEHGCEDSPITQMAFRIPGSARGAKPVAKDGWTTKVTRRTITFSGGSMPSDATEPFSITFTAPKTKSVLTWKIVQTCAQGVERWIESPSGDFPAPLVGVGKKVENAE